MDIRKPQNQESDKIFEEHENVQEPEQPTGRTEKSSGKGISFFTELIKIILLAFLIIIPIRTFIFQPFFVQGSSMEPNFHDGEYLIINELGYKKTVIAAAEKEFFSVDQFKDFQRGDPIVFRYPRNPSQYFIKRIIGLPGERVTIKNEKVTVYNDEHPEGLVLNESEYLPNHIDTKGDKEFSLGPDEYVVLGDNRTHSSDSRTWGVLPGDFIIGKVLLRAWPLDKFTVF